MNEIIHSTCERWAIIQDWTGEYLDVWPSGAEPELPDGFKMYADGYSSLQQAKRVLERIESGVAQLEAAL